MGYLKYLLLFVSISANADTNWARTYANTTLAVDWLQTIEISRNDNYHELNPILGRDPTQSDVNKYFATCILLTNIIGELLPVKYSDYFYISMGVLETGVTLRNYNMGIRIKF